VVFTRVADGSIGCIYTDAIDYENKLIFSDGGDDRLQYKHTNHGRGGRGKVFERD